MNRDPDGAYAVCGLCVASSAVLAVVIVFWLLLNLVGVV